MSYLKWQYTNPYSAVSLSCMHCLPLQIYVEVVHKFPGLCMLQHSFHHRYQQVCKGSRKWWPLQCKYKLCSFETWNQKLYHLLVNNLLIQYWINYFFFFYKELSSSCLQINKYIYKCTISETQISIVNIGSNKKKMMKEKEKSWKPLKDQPFS